jgi:hypothetical protein
MCPFCLATMGLIVAGSVSTGGLAALVVKVSHKNKRARKITADSNERSIQDVNEHYREPENCVAR